MLSLFRKKKAYDLLKDNATHEIFATKIVSACIRFQQIWADFMQRYTERLSRNGKLITLSLFCLSTGSLSLYLIANSMTKRKGSLFTVIHLKKNSYAIKSGDENTKALLIVTEAGFEKIQRFRFYMDSLARSPSGKKKCDSILSQRPGLMDSVLLIEKIYQSQNKK